MKRLWFAAVLLLAAAAAACSGGAAGSHAVPAVNPLSGNSNASVPAALQIKNWGQAIMNGATYVGPVTNAALSVTVQVHQQNAAGLVQYAQEVNNPASAMYRRFLTPQEIGQMFGAKLSDYQTVAQYFAADGLAVASWPQRLVLVVNGTQTNMEKAFGTTFGLYSHDGKEFVAPMTAPHFSTILPVDSVGRLANFHPEHTYMIPGSPRAGAGYATGFSPSTVRAAFDYIGAYNAGYTGSGVTIAIIGTGAIDTTNSEHGDVDLNDYATATNTSNVATVTEDLVKGSDVALGLSTSGINQADFPYADAFTATPAPPWAELNEDGESQLDTQQAATLAPGATVDFYLAYNADDCTGAAFNSPCPTSGSNAGAPEFGIVESDPEIQQVIANDTADVVSMSFGGGETQQGWSGYDSGSSPYVGSYSQLEFAALATEGIAVFASSGDDGSAECYNSANDEYEAEQCVSYPAGDPNVTSVGGITTNVDLAGQITAPWLAWGISTSDNGYGGQQGSGGGISTLIPVSSSGNDPWQSVQLGATMREQPDVSMDGDPSTGVSTVVQGQLSGIGGTSVAAPEMAAMWADVLSACVAHPGVGICPISGGSHSWRLGNASPYLYAIYKGKMYDSSWTPSETYVQTFYDILYGDNEMYSLPTSPPSTPIPSTPVPGFAAGPGYDLVTGIGVPFAGHLIDAVLNTTTVL